MTTVNTRALWRIEHPHGAVPSSAQLATGLERHLRYGDLHTVVMQIGQRQHYYVALYGCAHCAEEMCHGGCQTLLLRRLLRTVHGTHLRPATSGLAQRPYTRAMLAVPERNARALSGALLHHWHEARLTLYWPRASTTPRVVALLAVGAGETEPRAVLMEQGWRVLPLSARFAQHMVRAVLSPKVPALVCRSAPYRPTLLGPDDPNDLPGLPEGVGPTRKPSHSRRWFVRFRQRPDAPPASDDTASTHSSTTVLLAEQHAQNEQPPASDTALAMWLERVRSGAPLLTPTDSTETISTPSTSDDTPLSVSSVEVAPVQPRPLQTVPLPSYHNTTQVTAHIPPALVEAVVMTITTNPAFTSGQTTQRGVTRKRLIEVARVTEEQAKLLLFWFDQAQIIGAVREDRRWKDPRPLVSHDLDALRAALDACGAPTLADLPSELHLAGGAA